MKQKLILNENLENLDKVIEAESTIPVHTDMDIVITAAYDDSLNNDKHLEEVNKELDKRNEVIKTEEPKEEKVIDNMYTAKLTLDESLEEFVIDDAKAYTNKGNDAWQALSDDDDTDYHLDYDMYDFLYALFRGLEGNANRNPKNPLGHTIHTFSPTSEDNNTKGVAHETNAPQIGVMFGNPYIITLSAHSEEDFRDAITLCDMYKIAYRGPEARKNSENYWEYSMMVEVPMAAENYPMLLEDYFETIGLTVEDVMTPEFAKTYRNKLRRLNRDMEVYSEELVRKKIVDKYIAISYQNGDKDPEDFIPDLIKELKEVGVSAKKSGPYIDAYMAAMVEPEEDEEI